MSFNAFHNDEVDDPRLTHGRPSLLESEQFAVDSQPDAPPEGDRWSSWDGATHGPKPRPEWVITDLAVMEPDPDTCELVVIALHPGVTREQVVAATGWDVRFIDDLATTDEPTDEELDTLRTLQVA